MSRPKSRIIVGDFRLVGMREAPHEGLIELQFVPDSARDPILKEILYPKPEVRGMWVCFVPKAIADHLHLQSYYTIELKARK